MAPVAMRLSAGVDEDVLALAEAREQLYLELAQQRLERRLVGGDPLAAELVRLAADLRVPGPPADPVARLEHHDVDALAAERGRGGEAGDAGPDHRYIRFDDAIRQAASSTGRSEPALSLCAIPLGRPDAQAPA